MSEDKTLITRSGWEMSPADAKQAMEMAQWIAESGLVPKSFAGKPKDIAVAAAMGSKLGLDVFSSMAGIAVINGRPSIWGDILRGIVLAHPKCEDIDEFFEGEGDELTAVCVITRKGMSPYRAQFSVADAKTAGLWGRNVWANFSDDMLVNRAFGRAARRRFGDALAGIAVAEESIDAEIIKDVPSRVHDDEGGSPAPAAPRKPAGNANVKAAADEGIIPEEAAHVAAIPPATAVHDPDEKDEEVTLAGNITIEALIQVAKELASLTDTDTVKRLVIEQTSNDKLFKVMDVKPAKYQALYDNMIDAIDAVGA